MDNPQSTQTRDSAQVVALAGPDDDEIAFGCECANPVLQIERWLTDTQPPVLPEPR